MSIQVDQNDVILLCGTTLAIVSGSRLELNTLKSDDIRIGTDGAETEVTAWTNWFGSGNALGALVTLGSVLDQFDFLVTVGHASCDTKKELGASMELVVDFY